MKNDLTCGVVRDLLPSYVENLLGEESKEAVERHLKGCPDCATRLRAMTALEEPPAETAVREVDYLKRVERRNRRRIVVSVIATAVGLLAALGLKIFVIGTPLQVQTARAEVVRKERGYVEIYISSMGSANAYHGWQVETKDGVASIYAREVLVSFWFNSGGGSVFVNLKDDQGEPVREIWLGGPASGKLIWQNGQAISRTALELYEAKTPYLGDASALERILEILNIQTACGPYTMELQTDSRPYRWTLEFQNGETTAGTARFLGYQMLALVENLDEVCFRFPSSSGIFTAEVASNALARVTEEHNAGHGADWPVHESVKEYAESPLEYQRMVTLLEEMFLGTSGTTVTVVKP